MKIEIDIETREVNLTCDGLLDEAHSIFIEDGHTIEECLSKECSRLFNLLADGDTDEVRDILMVTHRALRFFINGK